MANFLSGCHTAPSNALPSAGFVQQSHNELVRLSDQRSPLHRERVLPLNEVAKILPVRNGRRTHYSTIYRWATKGVRGHVLESFLVGGIRYTTHEALERFVAHADGSHRDDYHTDTVDAALRQAGL